MRRTGKVILWLVLLWAATTTRSFVPPEFQDELTIIAWLTLAAFFSIFLIQEAPSIARTLRDWRDQL
jgi:hypothetical protein